LYFSFGRLKIVSYICFIKQLKQQTMEVLNCKKYNDMRTEKWCKDCEQARLNGRHYTMMPQLAFYIFNKNYGYVAFNEKKALWAKTKKQVIEDWKLFQRRGW